MIGANAIVVDSWEYWANLTVEEMFTRWNNDPQWGPKGLSATEKADLAVNDLRERFGQAPPPRGAYHLLGHAVCTLWRTTVTRLTSIHRLNLVELLASKQHDYGHGNILAFGHDGITVRISDKWERYNNLTAKQSGPRNEPLIDTLNDLLGYCVIGLMLLDGTFTKDLAGNYGPQEPSGE